MLTLDEMGKKAREAARVLARLGIREKEEGLRAAAEALTGGMEEILAANEKDVKAAVEKGMKPGLVDRLALDEQRVRAMADGLCKVAALEDPIGEVTAMKPRPNGLLIGEKGPMA